MSTNKTEHYALHAWVAGDDFLRSEFNENFAAIDNLLGGLPEIKKLKVAMGSYMGDEKNPRAIELGFRPKVVLVVGRCNDYDNYVGLYLPELSGGFGDITDTGFTVSGRLNWSPNRGYGNTVGSELNPLRYIALYWED